MTSPAAAPVERLPASLTTARFVVRLVEPGDLPDLLVVHADDEVSRFLPYETWRSMDDAHAWHARIVGLQGDGRLRQYVVVDRGDARVVGSALVFNVEPGHARAEFGYVLGRRDWRRGVMSEAMAALVAATFDALELRRLEAHVDPRNAPSIRLLERLGFVREGLMRERAVVKGQVVDSCIYGLLADELRRPDAAPG